jgi:hypothetical protein
LRISLDGCQLYDTKLPINELGTQDHQGARVVW